MERKGTATLKGAKRTVLVVEDNELNREMLCNILAADYEVVQAVDGLDGLMQLGVHAQRLSIVLLDVYMPGCDGFEFLRRKQAEERFDTIPVIVTTASDEPEDEIRCLELGANDFVLKPYNPTVILNRVGNLIRLRESAAIVNSLTWDTCTGLYSKEFFYHAVEDALAAYPDAHYDMVCSDIENLASLNDRYGEKNCERMLHGLADNIAAALPGYVAGGRIGEGSFAFLIRHQSPGWADALCTVTSGLPYANVNVKFGVVSRVDRTMTVPKMCNRALSALDTVRGRHGIEVGLFNDEMHQRQLMEQSIRDSMEQALNELQFSVFYQPKHDVHTNRIGGAEALVRWSHPEIGFISPGLFIPIFERNGFITKLDMFVWEEACKEIKRCQEKNLPIVPISVNASRLDFDLTDLPDRLSELADKHGVDHALLHLELTETAYADNPKAVAAMLGELKKRGFAIELDDFGSGYSSLVSLNTLPLDVMKLDMSVIQQAAALDDFRIVESTIKLAHVLSLETVIEGVETAEEVRRVTDLGCDMIQGYYYSRPLDRDAFEAYLAE